MILEGLPTFCIGILSWWIMADDEDTAWYLNSDEKRLLSNRRSRQQGQTASAQKMHRKDVVFALKDWKVYIFCIADFSADLQFFGYSTFLPTIVAAINPRWSSLRVQALTVPCYALGAISFLLVGRLSDALQRRAIFIIAAGAVCMVGYILLIVGSSQAVRYLGCFVVAMGLYAFGGLTVIWLALNQPRYGKRAAAMGMELMIGNSAGIAVPYVCETSFVLRDF